MAVTFDTLKPDARIFLELNIIHIGGTDLRKTLHYT